jgi:hypothetical protein
MEDALGKKAVFILSISQVVEQRVAQPQIPMLLPTTLLKFYSIVIPNTHSVTKIYSITDTFYYLLENTSGLEVWLKQ